MYETLKNNQIELKQYKEIWITDPYYNSAYFSLLASSEQTSFCLFLPEANNFCCPVWKEINTFISHIPINH